MKSQGTMSTFALRAEEETGSAAEQPASNKPVTVLYGNAQTLTVPYRNGLFYAYREFYG